jgi:Uncharacterized conserved protein
MTQEKETTATEITTNLKLILHNDPVNSFQQVIMVLVAVLRIDAVRAEQLATIAHYKGKAVVKEGGNLDDLMAVASTLGDYGLTVSLE